MRMKNLARNITRNTMQGIANLLFLLMWIVLMLVVRQLYMLLKLTKRL